ncbi:MAG: hypothetical protein K9N10_14935 [Deltaproteobacteria bacterium]|nr:hypothetical protein [Deltaproteobacteria bacterium]
MNAKKTLLITFGIFLLVLMLGLGAGVYYYTHPPKVKAIMEKVASRVTGAAVSIEHLDYSLNPIRIHAKGIVIQPDEEKNGFSAEIQDLLADCVLKGSFGQKRLVFKTLTINGLKCRVRKGAAAVSKGSGNDGSSFLGTMARSFVSLFLFKDISLEAAHVKNGFVVVSWGDRKITVSDLSGRLNADHLVHMEGRVLVESPTEHAILSIPGFHLDTTNSVSLMDPRIDLKAVFSEGTFSTPEAKIENIQGGASLHYDVSGQKIGFTDLALLFHGARFARTEKTPFDITLKAGGDIDFKKRRATLHGLSLDLKDLLQFDGKLEANFGDEPDFRLFLDEGRIFSRKLMSLAPLGENPAAFTISGPVDFRGIFSGKEKQGQWALSCDMKGNIKKSPISYRTDNIHLKGFMAGQVAVQGPVSHLDLSGEVTGTRISVKGKGISIQSAEGTLRFEGAYPQFNVTTVSCRMPRTEFTLRKKSFSVAQTEIDAAKGRVNVLERSLQFPEISFKSSLLNNIMVSFQMDGGQMTLTAMGKETGLLQMGSALKLLPTHWTFKGTDTFAVTATSDGTDTTSFSARLALEKFHFQNPQQTRAGENMSLRAHISGRMGSNPSTIKATAEIKADAGEVLMDRFYFDLGENAIFAQFNGSYQGDHNRLKVDTLSLGMKKIATAHVTGELFQKENEYEGEFSVTIPDTDIKSPFQRFVREPFQTEKPALSKIKVEGITGAAVTLKGKRSCWMATGRCTWKDGALVYGDSSVALTDIQLSLPVWLTHGNNEGVTEDSVGHLSVRSMRIPRLPEQGLNIPIQAAENGFIMPTATTLTVPGGTVRIGPSRIVGLMRPPSAIETALHFENLQLRPVVSRIWPRAVGGSADGHLNPIHIENGELQSKGEIRANVFDGAVTLSNVGARGLFTALPVYHLDAQWHHLNLAEMTEGTSFGKIEGILNGYAKSLEVSNGQLQRFDLLLDTVKTDDVPQKISVKAVDNIARLGGGQSPFAGLAGMFASFFKEFPYRKIGVHATLENDVFKINGTIQENGKEYLVKRGFFSGVDVINQNKENRVGFKDMLKRIKRITDSKEGPVIK